MAEPPRTANAKSSAAATAAVQAGILLSRTAGLVRERVMAHYLGLSDAAGAFSAALRIPNLLQNLFGEGALSASFIPVYRRLLEEGRADDARRVAGVIASLVGIAVGLLSLLGSLFSRPLIDVVAPGFVGDVRELTIALVAIMFPGVALLSLSAFCLGVLNSHRRFFLSYASPVLWNLAMVVALFVYGGVALEGRGGAMRLARTLAYATVLGSALQLAIMLPTTLRLLGGLRPSLSLGDEGVRRVTSRFGPAAMSRGVMQLSAYVDQVLASYLGPAVTAAMRSSQMLYLLPVSFFGVAVSAAELPEMSSAVGTPEEVAARLRQRLSAALARMAFFVVPSSAAFLVLGGVIAGAVFRTGRFDEHDADLVWLILAGSSVGLVAATQARLLSSAFWALSDTRTPLHFAIVRVTLTAVTGWAFALPIPRALGLAPGFGAAGLTASAGVSGWVEYLLLRRALVARIGRFGAASSALARAWLAALAAAGLAFAAHRALPFQALARLPDGALRSLRLPRALALSPPLVEGACVLALYGALYLACAALVGLPEARAILRRVRARLAR